MLGIIINPKSGKRAFRMQRKHLWQLLRKRHLPFTYRVTQYANHAAELACELVEKGYDQILVLGGDGTLSETINGIMQANIPAEQRSHIQVGLMPRGTGNDWGRYWGLNRDFKRSLAIFFEGNSQPVDVGCITFRRCNQEYKHYFINSVGFGIDAATCAEATTLKYYIGSHHVNYFFGLLKALFTHRSQLVHILSDQQSVASGMMFTMNVANGPYCGGGMKLNPDADPRDGIFHCMFLTPPSFKQILQAIPNLFNGELNQLPFITQFTGKRIQVDTQHHLRIESDGILMDLTGPCELTCMPHALHMIGRVSE